MSESATAEAEAEAEAEVIILGSDNPVRCRGSLCWRRLRESADARRFQHSMAIEAFRTMHGGEACLAAAHRGGAPPAAARIDAKL